MLCTIVLQIVFHFRELFPTSFVIFAVFFYFRVKQKSLKKNTHHCSHMGASQIF